MDKGWYVYIMSNKKNWTLYVGVTSNIQQRISEHKNKKYDWFTAKYWLDKLVWFYEFPTIKEAIEFEKKLKAWNRKKKIEYIESINKDWLDLFWSF